MKLAASNKIKNMRKSFFLLAFKSIKSFLLITLVLAASCLLCPSVYAQLTEVYPYSENVIKVDPLTRRPDPASPIPFDKPFTLSITLDKTDDIVNVFAYYVEVTNGKRELADGTLPIAGVTYRPVKTQLLVNFPALRANSHFDFCIVRKFSGKYLIALKGYADLLAKKNILAQSISSITEDQNFTNEEKNYTAFKDTIDKQTYIEGRTGLKFDYLLNSTYGSEVDRSLEEWFNNSIHTEYENILHYNYSYSFLNSNLNNFQLGGLVSSSIIVFNNNKQSINELNYLYEVINSGNDSELSKGLISVVNNYPIKPINILNFTQRITNIDSTIRRLNKIVRVSEKIQLTTVNYESDIAQSLRDALIEIISILDANKSNISSNYEAIISKIQQEKSLRYTEWYINTNGFKDLQTMSSYFILPQIGTGALIVRENNNSIKVIPKLLLGINIFLKPVDKNINRKYLNYFDWKNYISISIALSLGKFDDSEFDNLYNNNSLLIGPAVRIKRGLYVSAGASLYKQQDINPLIDKKNFAAGGYFSVLLDLDITKPVSAIRDAIFK